MLDLLSIVPYYTAQLCASLAELKDVHATPASITYHHDPRCFVRLALENDPGFVDLAWKSPAPLRPLLKFAEYLVNLLAYLVRFALRRPDAVHVQFLPLLGRGIPLELWYLKLMKAYGIRLVYTVHNVLPQTGGERFRQLYARVYSVVDHLICHDEAA